jgi:Na+/melibiose symporter-like transporter
MSQLRELLRIRDYRYLWTAQVLSDFGDNLTFFTLLILIQRLTGSTLALAGLMVAVALPTLIFGTLAGVHVDRIDRRKAMLVSDLLRAIVVLAFLFVRSEELIPLIYVIGFVQAAVGTVFNPARAAFLPAVVGTEKLLAANSVSQTSRIVFNLLGTAAAGILAAVGDTLAPAFIVDSLTFFTSFLLISRIRTSGVPETLEQSRVWQEMKGGFQVMVGSRPLRAVLISLSVTMLGLGAVNVLFVPFLIDDLSVSEAFLGAVEASQVAGLVVSGTLVAVLATKLRPSNLVSIGLLGVGRSVSRPCSGRSQHTQPDAHRRLHAGTGRWGNHHTHLGGQHHVYGFRRTGGCGDRHPERVPALRGHRLSRRHPRLLAVPGIARAVGHSGGRSGHCQPVTDT